MVTIQSADNVLKSYYLDAMTEALDLKANPLLAKIGRSTANVYGKDVRKATRFGMNGGVGAGSEDGTLPEASQGDYVQFVSTLKNLYGTIEITDKAIRAAQHNEGAFVNLLNDEIYTTEPGLYHGQDQHITIRLPWLGAVILKKKNSELWRIDQ